MKSILLIIVMSVFMISATLYAEEIEIIANLDFPSNNLSIATIKEIYMGEKTTLGDIRIKPYDQKNSKIRRKFLDKVVGTNEDGYNAYWIKKVFQEGGVPPLAKSSVDDIINSVKEDAGGIGYIWKHDGNASGIKVLLIIEAGD